MSEAFNILAGPASSELAEDRRQPATRISTPIGVAVGVAVAVWLIAMNAALIGYALLALPILAFTGWIIGTQIENRRQLKRSWLESEIEVAWFRGLNAERGAEDKGIDWESWESSYKSSESPEVNEYERGYQDGWRARGAHSEPAL